MKAIAQLLSVLPLQPEATDVDIMEAKSELFLKWVFKYQIKNEHLIYKLEGLWNVLMRTFVFYNDL